MLASFSFDFFWALCGQSGFPLAGKVFLSLKIGAWLEWQRAGGLLRTDMESSWNQDGFYLLAVAALFAVICCLYCSKHSMEQENCGLLLWHEPKQPLESSRVRKVGSGEGDVINCWKKPPCLGMKRAWHDSDGEGLRSGVGVFSRSVSPGLLPPGEGWGGSHDQLAGNSLQHVFFPTGHTSSLKTFLLHQFVRDC